MTCTRMPFFFFSSRRRHTRRSRDWSSDVCSSDLICVLDEVDAPLDDHNVERFCNLLHEITGSTETRFIIITHNPITMARMNRLFGVTMAERGVSQLVSVDLEDAVKILDQHVA